MQNRARVSYVFRQLCGLKILPPDCDFPLFCCCFVFLFVFSELIPAVAVLQHVLPQRAGAITRPRGDLAPAQALFACESAVLTQPLFGSDFIWHPRLL